MIFVDEQTRIFIQRHLSLGFSKDSQVYNRWAIILDLVEKNQFPGNVYKAEKQRDQFRLDVDPTPSRVRHGWLFVYGREPVAAASTDLHS